MSIAEDSPVKPLKGSRHYILGHMTVHFSLRAVFVEDSIEAELKIWIGASSFEIGYSDGSLVRLIDAAVGAIDLFLHLVERPNSDEHFDVVALFSHEK